VSPPEASGPGDLVIVDVEVGGQPHCTVRITQGRIAAIDTSVPDASDAQVLEGGGGVLLPGLHDHHLHLASLAARDRSVSCGPPDVTDAAQLTAVLRATSPDARGWIRGYGYDEVVAGELDRWRLDAMLDDPSVAVRIQHRSGHRWWLNSRALDVLVGGAAARRARLAHDAQLRAGILHGEDAWLRTEDDQRPTLDGIGRRLASFGVTGCTDASVTNGPDDLAWFSAPAQRRALPQRLVVMAGGPLPSLEGPVVPGARKVVLDDATLPSLAELIDTLRHAGPHGAALHCVTAESLVLAAAAIREAGGAHRIEHASVAPPGVVDLLATLPVTIVTQPGFIAEHGDRYLREVESRLHASLYRLAGWREAGVRLAAGSDAPFGPADPWVGIAGAVRRSTPSGARLGVQEALGPEAALDLYLSPLDNPGGPPRSVRVGAPGDLCLLTVPWRDAREVLSAALVRATVIDGAVVYDAANP
jgi:predicted amidohydrolase YtcJ